MVKMHNISFFDVERITIRQNRDDQTKWLKITLISRDGHSSTVTVFADMDGNYPRVEIEQEMVPLPAA